MNATILNLTPDEVKAVQRTGWGNLIADGAGPLMSVKAKVAAAIEAELAAPQIALPLDVGEGGVPVAPCPG